MTGLSADGLMAFSLNSLFFGKAAPISPNYPHFLATKTSLCSDRRDQIRLALHDAFRWSSLVLSLDCLGCCRFSCPRRDQPQHTAFLDRYVVGFVTLDEVLWRFS